MDFLCILALFVFCSFEQFLQDKSTALLYVCLEFSLALTLTFTRKYFFEYLNWYSLQNVINNHYETEPRTQ